MTTYLKGPNVFFFFPPPMLTFWLNISSVRMSERKIMKGKPLHVQALRPWRLKHLLLMQQKGQDNPVCTAEEC